MIGRFCCVAAMCVVATAVTAQPQLVGLEYGLSQGDSSEPVRAAWSLFGPVLATSLGALVVFGVEFRKRTVLAALLHEERQISGRLYDGSASGVITVDSERRITGWNPAMERLTGVTRSAAMQRTLDNCPALSDQRHLESIGLALGGIEAAALFAVKSAARTEVALRGYYAPLKGSGGRITGAIAIVNEARPLGHATSGSSSSGVGTVESSAA